MPQPCADQTPTDQHMTDTGKRTRCDWHHVRHKAWMVIRRQAEKNGEDVSGWTWEKARLDRPPHIRDAAGPRQLPEDLQQRLKDLLERLPEVAAPIIGKQDVRRVPTQAEIGPLGDAINEVILALERLLYAPSGDDGAEG